MKPWTRDRNIFCVRYKVDPGKKDDFLNTFEELCHHAENFYERGCSFAFQGWARDPNEFVVFASWDEIVVAELRGTSKFQILSQKLMDYCVEPVIIEQFAGMDTDLSVFEAYPKGSSEVHNPGEKQKFIFL